MRNLTREARLNRKFNYIQNLYEITFEDFSQEFLDACQIDINFQLTDDINEYQAGHRSSDLLKKYKGLQGCMEIQKWSNNTGHRGNEHYFASGKYY